MLIPNYSNLLLSLSLSVNLQNSLFCYNRISSATEIRLALSSARLERVIYNKYDDAVKQSALSNEKSGSRSVELIVVLKKFNSQKQNVPLSVMLI